MNVPLRSFVHGRALLLALTYLSAKLAPPGSQTSLFGLITLPVAYFPYALIGMDLLMGGPSAAAQSVTGAVVGHLWWWTVFDMRLLAQRGRAPGWLRNKIDGPGGVENAAPAVGGVHIIPPRQRQEAASATGHQWGSGNRLGTD